MLPETIIGKSLLCSQFHNTGLDIGTCPAWFVFQLHQDRPAVHVACSSHITGTGAANAVHEQELQIDACTYTVHLSRAQAVPQKPESADEHSAFGCSVSSCFISEILWQERQEMLVQW